jgi:hypothetical protein
MKNSKVADVVLWGLLALGFIGAAKVSYANMMGSPCPYLAIIPICYVVLIAYGMMIASVLIPHAGCKHYLFCAGWGTAFVIALLGSVAEIFSGGGVCPTAGGSGIRGASSGSIPLCFASLAMLVVILILFLIGPYKRACKVQNSQSHQD